MNTQRAEKILSLQLDWVKTADSKIPSIFAINIGMLGAITALVKIREEWTSFSIVIPLICSLLLLLSIGCLALAMFPRLKGPKGSNLFFGEINRQDEDSFKKEVLHSTDEGYVEDILSQSYRNAEIANSKYTFIQKAFFFTFSSVPLWLISIYLLYVK